MADEIVDPAERLDALIALQAPAFALGFRRLVAQIREAADLEQISELLRTGRLEDALDAALRSAPALGNLYLSSFVAAAEDTARFLGANLGTLVLDFDQTNQVAVEVMRNNRLRLIREFSRQQRDATRAALVDGIERGLNPIEQARAFRSSIGLTRAQVEYVNNYRRSLETGSADALRRELRDRRFDPRVARAVSGARPLTSAQVDRMVDRYRDRWVQHRSQVVGRTEALRSVHEGSRAMYDQAVEEGTLQRENLTHEWNTALDERVRGSHSQMHGQKLPYDQPFTSGDGNQSLYPGGFGVPSDDIQCRCAVGTRITRVSAPAGVQVEILS